MTLSRTSRHTIRQQFLDEFVVPNEAFVFGPPPLVIMRDDKPPQYRHNGFIGVGIQWLASHDHWLYSEIMLLKLRGELIPPKSNHVFGTI